MDIFVLYVKNIRLCLLFFNVFITLVCGSVFAAEINVTMEFKPSVFSPDIKTFTNTTPQGSFCFHIN